MGLSDNSPGDERPVTDATANDTRPMVRVLIGELELPVEVLLIDESGLPVKVAMTGEL